MIGRIKGELVAKGPSMAVVMCGGLGYEVDIPLSTGFELPEAGAQVHLYTHFVVREDHQALHGFSRENERDLFRILIKVNGVGAKLAMAILSTLDAEEVVDCVRLGDINTLTSIPGIGKKTAERLIMDVADKVEHLAWIGQDEARRPTPKASQDPRCEEAESALVALGYKPKDAAKAVAGALQESMTVQELIRTALKSMMPAN